MNNFIENFKSFMEHYKIKQTILAIKTGYDKNKISRLLNGKNTLNVDDMQILASAVGKEVSFFMNKFEVVNNYLHDDNEIAFYAGTPTKEKEQYANQLFDLLEHIDLILGMENKINCDLNEV